MFEGIKSKKVLITGATGGMGESIALLFAEYGAELGLHYNQDKEKAEALIEAVRKKSGKAEIFQADLLKVESCKELIRNFIKTFGGIDVLINNAGTASPYVHFSELEGSAWDTVFNLNVKAPYYLTGEAFSYMQEHGGGRVVNMGSVNVKYGGSGKSLHYVASKAALESLAKGFAKEGAPHNILVNTIRCGLIDTPMRKNVAGYNEEHFKQRVNLVPLKRAGDPLDIARTVLFLAAETGDFITGEIFTVAGGD